MNSSETAGDKMLKFLHFPKTKLDTFPEKFKLITATGAIPGHRKLGGHIRKARLSVKHHDIITVCSSFANSD